MSQLLVSTDQRLVDGAWVESGRIEALGLDLRALDDLAWPARP